MLRREVKSACDVSFALLPKKFLATWSKAHPLLFTSSSLEYQKVKVTFCSVLPKTFVDCVV